MAVKKRKTGVGVALVVMTALLALLVQYLWNFNYNARGPESHENFPTMRASIDVSNQILSGAPVLCANLHLTNSGSGKLRLVDTVTPDPLYNLQLQRLLPNGGSEAVGMSSQRMMISSKATSYFDPQKDSEVILLPGRTVTVRFALNELFDLRGVAGKYHLDIQYRPQSLLDMLPPDQADRPNPDMIMVACQADFELPLKAPEPLVNTIPGPVERPAPPTAQPTIGATNEPRVPAK
jgi:hypothetical protein